MLAGHVMWYELHRHFMHIWIFNNVKGGWYVEGKCPLLRVCPKKKKTHLAEMGSFRGKFEILRTITESAIFQQAGKGFGFPSSICK